MHKRNRFWAALLIPMLLAASQARAQFAVIDVGAIAQLMQQLESMREQIETAREHLDQAHEQYESMTGARGMEDLLSDTARNYLPPDWVALADALEGLDEAYSGLSASLRGTITENAFLTDAQLARLSPSARREIQRQRELTAMSQVMAQQALSNTSQRFGAVQQLIDAIPRATDQKGVLDLQARIAAEQAMLANEQTKLDMIHQTLEAEAAAHKQRMRERAISDIGSFRNLPPLELP